MRRVFCYEYSILVDIFVVFSLYDPFLLIEERKIFLLFLVQVRFLWFCFTSASRATILSFG